VIGALLVRDVTTAHVIKVLEPIWTSKTETATRVRSRMELVLDFAAARGLRDGPNPARWRGNLDAALPSQTSSRRLSITLQSMLTTSLSLWVDCASSREWVQEHLNRILTAARSGEVRGAVWSEVNLAEAL